MLTLFSWQMLKDVIEAANESMFIEDEQYVLVVDLFILRPELQLQVTTGDSHHSQPIIITLDVFIPISIHLIFTGFRYLMEEWRD